MTPETTVSIGFIISILALALSIIGSIRTGKRDEEAARKRDEERIKADNAKQLDIEKNFVAINYKLDDFSQTFKQLMKENGEKTDELNKTNNQLIVVNEQIKALLKKADDHEARIKSLEHSK